jgi:DNA (cytosine-5)-methyltransferase 1
MTAFYNENDPRMAACLRELIAQGHIAPGVVDERSITEVRGADLAGFTQCHFFAGIGVWSHALRRAGWPDDRPCWTGSCPCQPFSMAGKGGGFDDSRHLWPHWFRLIGERRPDRVFGEQVASAGEWLDLVAADLEGLAYAFAAVDLPAAGFGGAHIRQRFFWVADAHDAERWADRAPRDLGGWPAAGRLESDGDAGERGGAGGVAIADGRNSGSEWQQRSGQHRQFSQDCGAGGLANDDQTGCSEFGIGGLLDGERAQRGNDPDGRRTVRGLGDAEGRARSGQSREDVRSEGPPRGSSLSGGVGDGASEGLPLGPWTFDGRALRLAGSHFGAAGPFVGCDWLLCHDGRIRPVESGTFPLVDAAPARLGRLHGYGNAIDAETATQFIAAFLESEADRVADDRLLG